METAIDRLIREKEVLLLTGYSRSAFRRAWSGGKFPRGFRRGRTRLWSLIEVQKQIAEELQSGREAGG